MGQSAEGLRLETDVAQDVEAEAMPPPRPRLPRITIGDDQPQRARRRKPPVDPYAPQGLRMGAFLLFPSLEAGSVIASNPRKATTNPKADVGLRLRPELRFESDWVRHSLSGNAFVDARQFMDDQALRTVTGSGEARLRLDVRRGTRADLSANYAVTSTGLGSNELPATAVGTRLDQVLGARAGITHDFGGLEGQLRLGVSRNLFGKVELSGGGSQDNSDRNYTELSVAARAGLRTGGILQPFTELAYEPRLYDEKRDRNGRARDSQGLRLSLGVFVDDGPIWTGEVAATLALRDYADESLKTAFAPGLTANLAWRPTDLTQFEFNAGTTLAETIDANVSAARTWSFAANVRHSLRDNVSVRAGLSAAFKRAADDAEITTVGSLGVDWTLNPSVVLSAGYEGTFFNSPVAGGDYQDHRLLTSIILRR